MDTSWRHKVLCSSSLVAHLVLYYVLGVVAVAVAVVCVSWELVLVLALTESGSGLVVGCPIRVTFV